MILSVKYMFLFCLAVASVAMGQQPALDLNVVYADLRHSMSNQMVAERASGMRGTNSPAAVSNRLWLVETYRQLGYEIDIEPHEYGNYAMALRLCFYSDAELTRITNNTQMMAGPYVYSRDRNETLRSILNSQNLEKMPFDRDQWLNYSATTNRWARYRMLKSLREVNPLEGQSRSRIVALLGPPESESESKLIYFVSPQFPIPIDDIRLILHLEHGVVTNLSYYYD